MNNYKWLTWSNLQCMGVHKLQEDSGCAIEASDIPSGKTGENDGADSAISDKKTAERQEEGSFDEQNAQEQVLSFSFGTSSAQIPWIPPLPINNHARAGPAVAEAVDTPLVTARVRTAIKEGNDKQLGENGTSPGMAESGLIEKVSVSSIFKVSADGLEGYNTRKEGHQSNAIIRAEIGDAYEEIPISVPTHVPVSAKSSTFAGPRNFAGLLWKRVPSLKLMKVRKSGKSAASGTFKLHK